ncbi:MAG: (2Fe-2S)-binding protein [Anaeromicrobium sp.]|uniref:(2Fe-2S)-binding protein n=1 Tax=Anaeromicrobium sp. TaxID=1929132 RepID=UPI0025DEC9BC|nr:(2Fe-2S)-binding protein [Anaeromicrobium sp.]MCT4593543.1 (2Fe-2S)-binding protein [Anaeromicrobium sp.]
MVDIEVNINGKDYNLMVEDHLRLIDLLRDKLNLTGTKEGCGEGECGACTVLVDEKSVNSCLILAGQVHGKRIITIEGLGNENNLDPIQRAFLEKGAVQCGFCTPGMILSAKALLHENNRPNRHDIREAISGNLCRCTGYEKIVDSILWASKSMKGEGGLGNE